jgi:ABC-type nitrate/sulfonate/bicarbonate transport system substrate-binding protein
MIRLRLGGVPEHFNLPWQLAREAGRFEPIGVELTWRDYPGGSGAMTKALRDGELDAAVLLTEGAVAGIAGGAPFKIVSLYTDSPLIWGVHVPAASRFRSEGDLRGARYAISREGSGSHLMAFVHARARGWPVEGLAFVEVGNLAGAVAAFTRGTADVFFWEKFMTKPLVDAGQFRRVGEFSAPWPAFVVCVADSLAGEASAAIIRTVSLVLEQAQALRTDAAATEIIAERFGLAAPDVADWLTTTRWSSRVGIAVKDVTPVCEALRSLGVLARAIAPEDCVLPASRLLARR